MTLFLTLISRNVKKESSILGIFRVLSDQVRREGGDAGKKVSFFPLALFIRRRSDASHADKYKIKIWEAQGRGAV